MALHYQIEQLPVCERRTDRSSFRRLALQNRFTDSSSFPVADQLVRLPRPSKLYTSVSLCIPLPLSGHSVTARWVCVPKCLRVPYVTVGRKNRAAGESGRKGRRRGGDKGKGGEVVLERMRLQGHSQHGGQRKISTLYHQDSAHRAK